MGYIQDFDTNQFGPTIDCGENILTSDFFDISSSQNINSTSYTRWTEEGNLCFQVLT